MTPPSPRVVAISSWVGVGHVGLSAIGPALTAIGARTLAAPTVILSNHPAWPNVAGARTPPAELRAFVKSWRDNGWLDGVDAVLTGYLPSRDHVLAAAEIVADIREVSPSVRYVCDPVIGDEPGGLYVDPAAAAALRDALAPIADVLTPNRFELGWLSDRSIGGVDDAVAAARSLPGAAHVIATSPPAPTGEAGALDVPRVGAPRLFLELAARKAPNGLGDAFAGLIAAGCPVDLATARVSALARMSDGQAHLAFHADAAPWVAAAPKDPRPLDDAPH